MNKDKLSDHLFKGGKFITPWNNLLGDLTKNESWNLNRFPEYLWLALILDKYERKKGLEKAYYILKKLNQIDNDMKVPAFSSILSLSNDKQDELYSNIVKITDSDILTPLTLIYTYSEHNVFSKFFSNSAIAPKERQNIIIDVMEKGYMHQSDFATDIRFLVLFFSLLSDCLKIPKEQLELILEYPKLDHSNEKMRIIRPTIRSMEIALCQIETLNSTFLEEFWRRISKMSDCKLYALNWSENNKNADKYMELLFETFEYFNDCFISTSPLDKKKLVLLGLATFSYKRVLEIYEHNLYNSIVARSSIRTIIESYIMMKYLLKSEKSQTNIWEKYQMYGIGLYKLVLGRYRNVEKELPDSHIDYEYLELLVNEFIDEKYIDMDTSYFDKQSIRQKADEVDEKDLFGLYYDYDSSFEHGLWGAIRESALLKCNSPAHQYHCTPDYENKSNLKSVWSDCIMVMNKIINLLDEIFTLPEALLNEVNSFEK